MVAGHVTAGGKIVRPRDPAVTGSRILVTVPDPEPSDLRPEAIPLAIVFEDEHLIVVDKPAGLVVHPGAGVRTGTLVHALLSHAPDVAAVGGVGRPGIVHRLDRDTSGLLVVAKNDVSHRRLSEAIARREVKRDYWALVWGEPRLASGRVEAPIGRHSRDRMRLGVTDRGRPAATRYRVLESFRWASFMECALETGRTHQIRVHLSHLGYPVFADPTYGGGARRALNLPEPVRRLAREVLGVMPRQALHAARLEFSHPTTGRALVALELLRRSVPGAPAVRPSSRAGR